MASPSWAERVAALEFMNAEVTREIQWLADSFSDLDTKLLAFLGFIGLAVPYILMHRRGGIYWLIPITVFGVTAISGFRALRPRKLSSAPEPYAIIDAYEVAVAKGALNTKEILLGEVLGTKAAAYRQDLEAIRNKASWYRRTEILLAVALVLSVFAVHGGSGDAGTSRTGRPGVTTSIRPDTSSGVPGTTSSSSRR